MKISLTQWKIERYSRHKKYCFFIYSGALNKYAETSENWNCIWKKLIT